MGKTCNAFNVFLTALLSAGALAWSCDTAAQTTPPAGTRPAAPAQRVDDAQWQALADQAESLLDKGDFSGAERVGRSLVEEGRRVFGEGQPNLAASYSILGNALLKQGRYAEADALFRQALDIYERRSGPESVNVAAALNSLALVLERQADYAGAEVLLRRSARILDKALGPNHPDTATTLSNLGRVLNSQGKLGGDAALAATAARPAVPAAGPAAAGDNPQQLAARAEALAAQGQFDEAETLHDRALAIYQKTLGPEHPITATGWSNLGNVRLLQGKLPEAEAAHRRALAIREKVLGPEHPDTATSLNNLANALLQQGKDEQVTGAEQRARAVSGQRVQALSEVETLYRRALAIRERALGPDHPDVAKTLNDLSALLDQQGKSAEAEVLQRRALAILEKRLGPLHPDVAATLTTLAVSLDRQGKVVESEQVYLRAVDTSRKSGNPRMLLLNTQRLGFALAKRGRYREALPYYREAVETLDRLYVSTRGLSDDTRQAFLGQFGNIYLETIRLLLELHRQNPQGGYDRQILEIASRNQSRTFTEMMRIADVAKFSAEPAFQALRGRRDALRDRGDALRQALVTLPQDASARAGAARYADLSAQADATARELKDVEDQLLARYPRYMELTNPRPVTAEDLQTRLLKPGEALLTFVLLPQDTIVFGLTRERLKMAVSKVRREDIARRVLAVRRSIDKATSADSVLFLREIDPANLYSLYRDVVQPVADVLAGADKVIVVGDGPLHTLPLEMLVTHWNADEQQAFRGARGSSDGSAAHPFLAEYDLPAWLGSQLSFAYLPSLSALTSQRAYPKSQGRHAREFVAFADPEFSPVDGKQFPTATQLTFAAMGASLPRSRNGEPAIPRLVETAAEAREIAAVLGGKSNLFIGANAQERSVKAGELKDARYVLFATHGILGGDFLPMAAAPSGGGGTPAGVAAISAIGKGAKRVVAQPSLVLSLVGDLNGEDGFLTMKEVIEDLELDADLVALSACNTAGESAQANNGEGFAGLTRAFMYAGARSLLVSHWSVDSVSTEALMTATFRNIKGGQSALAAMSDARRRLLKTTYTSGAYSFSRGNPFFWAPFVYVGD